MTVHRFPASRIVRLAPRGGMLTDGTPCRLLAIGCGRVKAEYLAPDGHVRESWFDAEHVLLREYQRIMGDDRPSDTEQQ